MSNNGISGHPSDQWYNYSEITPAQIPSSPVPSPSQPSSPVAEQQALPLQPRPRTLSTSSQTAGTSVTTRLRATLPTSANGDVRTLTPDVAQLAMDTFRANLADWQPKADASGLDKDQSAWNEKLGDTLMYLNEAQRCAVNADKVVGVFVSGAPVGFAVLDKRGDAVSDPHERHAYLAALVVHPGSRRVGGMLIEQAASASQEWGSEGRVRLAPGSYDSGLAYKALGFADAPDDEECMELQPAQTVGWEKRGDVWSLSKFHSKPVIVGLLLPKRSVT